MPETGQIVVDTATVEKSQQGKRILLVDDHQLVREVLERYIVQDSPHAVSTAGGFLEARKILRENGPFDLVLLDYCLPDMFGLENVSELIEENPNTQVAIVSGVVFDSESSDSFIHNALRLGVIGILPKNIKAEVLLRAIDAMLSGLQYVPVNLMLSGSVFPEGQRDKRRGISDREYEVLCLVALGMQNKHISEKLTLREPTVKMHIQSLFRKLGASNRTELVRIAKTSGML